MRFSYRQIRLDYSYKNRSVTKIVTAGGAAELRVAEHENDVIYYRDFSSTGQDGSCSARTFADWYRRKNT